MTGKRKADDDIPGTSQPPAGPTPKTPPTPPFSVQPAGAQSERGTEQLQPTGRSRERGRVIGEQVNSSQDDVPVRNSTIHIRMALYTAAAAAAAISVNHPVSLLQPAGAAVEPRRSAGGALPVPQAVRQAFPGYVPHQAFLGDAPQNLLPPGPGPRPTPRAGINNAQHQMAPSSSRQSAQPQMRLQRGGAPRHNRSNLPRDDAQQRRTRILEATARRALQQQEKSQKLEQEQATMSAPQEKLRLHHPAAVPQAQTQASFPVGQTVAASRTLQLPQPQSQANAVSMCWACGVRLAMTAPDPTQHLCLCVDCFSATGDDPNTACPVCRAHRTGDV